LGKMFWSISSLVKLWGNKDLQYSVGGKCVGVGRAINGDSFVPVHGVQLKPKFWSLLGKDWQHSSRGMPSRQSCRIYDIRAHNK
jgi:hypothetical protein